MAEKILFKSRLSKPERHYCSSGSRYATTYEIKIDDRGHKELVPTGETNIYEAIQVDLEASKIENIVKRVMLGDEAVLHSRQTDYIDMTEMPTTLAEAQNMINDLTNEFNKLDVDTREKFNHSPSEYIASFGSNEWAEKMGLLENTNSTPISNPIVEKGVVENATE